MISQETKDWASKKFDIPAKDIVWYNHGSCYDRIIVKTEESAKKVHEKVKGERVNGGMLDGMPLGGISELKSQDGIIEYDVTC